jgi:hypothetical protein
MVGILLPSIFSYLASIPMIGNFVENFGINVNASLSNATLPNIVTGTVQQGIVVDRRLFSDSLFFSSAIFIAFSFCALLSGHSDFMYLISSIGFMAVFVVLWPTLIGNMLGLQSLLVSSSFFLFLFLKFLVQPKFLVLTLLEISTWNNTIRDYVTLCPSNGRMYAPKIFISHIIQLATNA